MGSSRRALSEVGEVAAQMKHMAQEIAFLRKSLDHQKRLLQGVWKIVQARGDVTDSDLLAELDQIVSDEAESESKTAAECSACHRPLQGASTTCIYCGATSDAKTLF
jgi:hypothetical protein